MVDIVPFDAGRTDALGRLEGIEADDRSREKSAKDVRCHDDSRNRGSPSLEISNCWQGVSPKQRCQPLGKTAGTLWNRRSMSADDFNSPELSYHAYYRLFSRV